MRRQQDRLRKAQKPTSLKSIFVIMKGDLDAKIKAAKDLAREQKYEESLNALDSLIEQNSDNPSVWTAWVSRGYVNDCKGSLGTAISDLTEAIRLAPPEPDNFFTRGRYLFRAKR